MYVNTSWVVYNAPPLTEAGLYSNVLNFIQYCIRNLFYAFYFLLILSVLKLHQYIHVHIFGISL